MNSTDHVKAPYKWGKQYLVSIFAASTTGLIIGFVSYMNDPDKDPENITVPVIVANSIALFNLTGFFIFNRYIDRIKNSAARFFAAFMLILTASTIGSEFSFFICHAFIYHNEYHPFKNPVMLTFNCLIGLIFGFSFYAQAIKEEQNALTLAQKDLKIMELNQLKTKAELETLQSKINPHFLYNALNSISGLIHEDANKAEQMTINLSKLFRYSINTQGNNYSSIKEELEMVKTYLDIEKVRFGDKLDFKIDASPDSTEYLIPRFLIQPLVENAIKHGTSKLIRQGILQIRVVKNINQVEISVQDNGAAFPSDLVSGYGLQSTHEKLNLLFPGTHEVQILNGKEKQVKIILKQPIIHEPAI